MNLVVTSPLVTAFTANGLKPPPAPRVNVPPPAPLKNLSVAAVKSLPVPTTPNVAGMAILGKKLIAGTSVKATPLVFPVNVIPAPADAAEATAVILAFPLIAAVSAVAATLANVDFAGAEGATLAVSVNDEIVV